LIQRNILLSSIKYSGHVAGSRLPLHPLRPERVCWGCDRYCPAEDLYCGNGTIRAPHPAELFGEDWLEWPVADGLGSDRTQPPKLR